MVYQRIRKCSQDVVNTITHCKINICLPSWVFYWFIVHLKLNISYSDNRNMSSIVQQVVRCWINVNFPVWRTRFEIIPEYRLGHSMLPSNWLYCPIPCGRFVHKTFSIQATKASISCLTVMERRRKICALKKKMKQHFPPPCFVANATSWHCVQHSDQV